MNGKVLDLEPRLEEMIARLIGSWSVVGPMKYGRVELHFGDQGPVEVNVNGRVSASAI